MSLSYIQRTVTNVYENSYSYGCDDSIMHEYCDTKCIFYKRKDFTLEVLDNIALEKEFVSPRRSRCKYRLERSWWCK